MKRNTSQIIGKIFVIIFTLSFMIYGIIQFCKNYCFEMMKRLDLFLEKDINLLIVLGLMIIGIAIIEIINHKKFKKNNS